MQIGTNPYSQTDTSLFQNTSTKSEDTEELTFEEEMEKSAVEVSISMGAQSILNSQNEVSVNTNAQKSITDFLAGKQTDDGYSLADIGYTGKPISELSPDEAQDLVSDDGYFGVEQTSNRVADFVLSYAGDDLENLQKSREGVVQGFDDAKNQWNGDLPDISYETQEQTLKIIDERIAQLQGESSTSTLNSDSEIQSVDITV